MKENRYDDKAFFDQYSQMARSQQGLAGAGEWPTLRALLPDFSGKQVLDMGCGYGWHAAYAAQHGAKWVVACDISRRMLEVAREKNAHPSVEYRQVAFEDAQFPEGGFDVALCSLMLHYLASYEEFLDAMRRWLCPGGTLIYTVEHPIFTAQGPQDWCYGPDGEILHFPVDHYFEEGERDAVFLGEHVVKYHRTLTTYLDGLLTGGFQLLRVVEPQPPARMLGQPGMRDELRRPMMLLVSARKRTAWPHGKPGRRDGPG